MDPAEHMCEMALFSVLMGQARKVRSAGWSLRCWIVEFKTSHFYKGTLYRLHDSLSEALNRYFYPLLVAMSRI